MVSDVTEGPLLRACPTIDTKYNVARWIRPALIQRRDVATGVLLSLDGLFMQLAMSALNLRFLVENVVSPPDLRCMSATENVVG
jgi:hypothetical protein